MARRHEEEENYWPGFVDALSTIVMVVVLLMIIVVIVIFSMAQMTSKTKQDIEGVGKAASTLEDTQTGEKTNSDNDKQGLSQSQSEQTVGTPITQKSEIVEQEELIEAENTLQIQSRKIVDEKSIIVATEEERDKPSNENDVKVESAQQVLNVLFTGTGVELNEEAKQEISQYLEENRAALEVETLTAWSFYDSGSVAVSQAKRKAYFRLLAVRNILIENGFTGENLTVNVRPAPTKEEVDRVLVFVK